MRHPLSMLAVLALALALSRAAASQPVWERLTRADGLPSDYVLAVHQDRWGFVWFGTDAGAVRWDGARPLSFGVDDGLPHPYVTGFAETADGTLWAATNGGLARRTEAGWEPVASPLGSTPIGHIMADGEGRLVLTDAFTLARREGDGWRTLRLPDGLGLGAAPVLDVGNGRLLTSGRREAAVLLFEPEGEGFRARRLPIEGLVYRPHNAIVTVYPRGEGRVGAGGREFIGTVNGRRPVGGSDLDDDRVVRLRFDGHSLRVTAETRIPRGVGSLAWHGGALYMAGSGGIRPLDPETGVTGAFLTESDVQAILTDREGGLWVGTFGQGAMRLIGTHLTALADLPARRVALVGDEAWGFGAGGATWLDLRGPAPGVRPYRRSGMRSGVATPDGRFRISGQAYLYGAGTSEEIRSLIPVRNGLRRLLHTVEDGNWVSGSAETADSLWLGSYGSGLRRFLKTPRGLTEVDTVGVGDGLPTETVEDVIRTSAGTWAITRQGLALVSGGRARAMGTAEGLPSSSVFSLFEAADGTHWAGTDRGVARLDIAAWRAEPAGTGAMDGRPVVAWFERHGTLYAVTTRALWRIEGGDARLVDGFPLVRDGRQTVEHAVYHPGSDRLVLATSAGAALADLSALPASAAPSAPVALVSATVDDVPAGLLGTPRDARLADLPPGRHRVAIQAAALRYGGDAGVEWRMPGEDWHEAADGRVVLSDVGVGTHRIEVRAVGTGGAVSEETARLTFRVAPRWWERRGVQAVLVLLGLGALVAGVRAVSQRRLRARVRELELAERVRAERERISRDLHDHVGAEVAAILTRAEVGRLRATASGRDPGAFQEVEDRARRTMGSLREAIWALGGSALTPAALASRLEQFATDQATPLGLSVRARATGDAERSLAPAQALALYRIGQEAVRNAVRHSGATRVTVTVEATGARVAVVVRDDGQFRPDGGDGRGLGLGNMQARAEALGGSFALTNGGGTTVRAEIPVE